MSNSEFEVFCPECNLAIAAKVIAQGDGSFRSEAVNPDDVVDSEYHVEQYYVCVCGRCSQPFLIRQSRYGVPADFDVLTDEVVLYPSETKLPLDGVPTTIKAAYLQAARSFTASLFEPCALMCRKCLEATCSSFGAVGRDLNARLESLANSGVIDSRLLEWAHGIRVIGNEAAHDASTVVTKRDARDVLDLTEAILIYVFSLTMRFEAFKKRRGDSKKKLGNKK